MTTPLTSTGRRLLDRRVFLGDATAGLASIALSSLLSESLQGTPVRRGPAPRAKRVIQLFASGAISQLDTFDYKPELLKRHGQPMPGIDKLVTFQGENGNLTRSPWAFRPRGECGKHTSDLLPQLGELVDRMCFIHSMTSRTATHGPGENFMSTGFTLDGFPSMGSWVSYALGSDNRDLPTFVAIPDPRGVPQASANNWGCGFLPAQYQGTPFNMNAPLRNLAAPEGVTPATDQAVRDYLKLLNDRHLSQNPGDTDLAGRIAAHELAARMQLSVPEACDLSSERPETLAMYGADSSDKVKAGFARNCILARRLVERDVRFVQLFNGAYAMGEGVGNWDGHKHLKSQYTKHGPVLDQPAAALLRDLERRGLLEDTLFVFTTEFGRMPTFQKGASGRDHNAEGFTVWMAGAGVKAPFSFGATDEFGHRAEQHPVTVYDMHATILHILGLDHTEVTWIHNGSERRLTDVHGHVITDVLA